MNKWINERKWSLLDKYLWKLEFWNLEIEFRNWKFEELFRDKILNKWINELNNNNNENNNDWINTCENWNFGIWKLNLEIGNLKNYLEMKF